MSKRQISSLAAASALFSAPINQETSESVKRSDTANGFEVLPRRWVVERTFAWLSCNRRLAKDFEQTIASTTTWLFIASIQLFARRIERA